MGTAHMCYPRKVKWTIFPYHIEDLWQHVVRLGDTWDIPGKRSLFFSTPLILGNTLCDSVTHGTSPGSVLCSSQHLSSLETHCVEVGSRGWPSSLLCKESGAMSTVLEKPRSKFSSLARTHYRIRSPR